MIKILKKEINNAERQKMNKEYFKNIPNVGSLYLERILFSFENIPIVFVCLDKDNFRYLCLCDDIIDEEAWIIVKISNETLLMVLNDEITVLSAFRGKTIIIANKGFEEEIKYYSEEYDKIDPDELPVTDQFLEMRDSLSDYINKINYGYFYSYPQDFKLDFSTYDHILFNSQLSKINFCQKNYNNILEEYYEDSTNVNYNFFTNLQVKYEKIESNVQNELDKNGIDISYAA